MCPIITPSQGLQEESMVLERFATAALIYLAIEGRPEGWGDGSVVEMLAVQSRRPEF